MQAESQSPEPVTPAPTVTPTSSSMWGVRLWAGMLLVLVSCWVGWGVMAFVRHRPAQRYRAQFIRTPSGQIRKIEWKRPDYRYFQTFTQVVREAKASKKPIFLDLYADWCAPCKKLEKETFSHPSVHPVLAKYLVVKFNVDKPEGRSLAQRFRVQFYPTTFMLDSDGREIERVIGFYPPRYYKPALDSVLKGEGFYADLLRRHRNNPNNLEIRYKLAKRSILRKHISQAQRLFRGVWSDDIKNQKGWGAKALFGLARSYVRDGKYKNALPLIAQYHKRYPEPGKVQLETFRLEGYCYERLRRYPELKRVTALIRKHYPGADTQFK